MQKKLIALAVASLVSVPAFAQSNVTIYGVIDVGVESAKFNDADGNLTKMITSGNTTNRIGFKGTEDLGNGMKANFVLEGQPSPDVGTHAAAFWGRLATVGLSGASWGSINLGSQYTPWFSARASNDIFYTAGAGSNYNYEAGDTRMSNSIRYDSVNMNGFTVAAMYGMGEAGAAYNAQEGTTAATKKQGQSVGLWLNYANGPLALRYAYDSQIITQGPDVDMVRNHVNGSYDFKVVKLVAGWNSAKLDGGATDNRNWYIGGVMPIMGKDLLKAEYTDFNNKTGANRDSKMFALGYEHMMSQRTVLYATYSKITNESAAAVSFLTGGGAVTAGFDPSSFQAGIKHSF